MLRFQNILKVLIVAAIIILPWLVSAQFQNQNQDLNLNQPPTSSIQTFADLYKFLQRVLKAVWVIFFAVAAIFIVLAAFSYLFAVGGDQEKVSKAKKQFMYAIVAIVIAFVAVGIDNIVESILNPQTPGTGQ